MQLIFLDDSKTKPSREGMKELVGIGGVSLPAASTRAVETKLEAVCRAYGFPPREPFKWSPGKELWMREGLRDEARQNFYLEVLAVLRDAGGVALVAAADKQYKTATAATTHESDVVNLLLERAQLHLTRKGCDGLVIADRPGGGAPDLEKFLLGCLEMRQEGAGYTVPERICINVVSSPSKFIRLLQAADLIVSCSLSRIGGEYTYSPPVFEAIRPLLFSDGGRVGGIGLKLHPDYVYANLYHWIDRDSTYWRFNGGWTLPLPDRPYSQNEFGYYRKLIGPPPT